MFEHLLFSVSDGICQITLNRPQVHNALSPALIREITSAIQTAGADDTVRVVILTGAGDKAFCSGADLKEAAGQLQGTDGFSMGDLLRSTYHPMIRAIRNLPKPVVCRLNGVAAGAGCSLALACDVVIATDEGYLSLLFVGIGLMPDAGSTFFLPRLLGAQRAFELCSTGRRVYGPEAAQLGLVTRSVPAAELDNAVAEIVTNYASAPTQAIGLMKLALNQSLHNDLEAQLEQEAQYQNQLGQSRDAAEGIMAFLQKRKPIFMGK
ncbi:enoyl-CoA hydratase/isomerase family protein [Larkinella arboricola]|uniref:2-(1,2-epoxy-1,2-dihydrophenyl)acetyl-CoA isomerase n=1 Tax=Larkinella arboricola TaxID=643671 RepID=A0A327WT43_LARAB|nr:enoyl-CoA hydratase [Larkinella arboricola]RAJ95798.1 2-(1,2-epoxy-1,2-dihydrophenyl)acetyl-CoA isomerase [Larkinella arboricola]